MTGALLLLVTLGGHGATSPSASAIPRTVVIATASGETAISVAMEFGYPTLPAPSLVRVLPITGSLEEHWAVVTFAGQPFRFFLGAPVMVVNGRFHPLVGGAYFVRDTLFVPLQWLAEFVPRMFSEGYRYDPLAARFEESRLTPVLRTTTSANAISAYAGRKPPSRLARSNGFRLHHQVVIDAGHGGVDPGNPGIFLPSGVQEMHVNLAIAQHVRAALEAQGVEVVMTRTRDTLIALEDRAPMCRAACDAFVSIHVNSMPRRRGYQNVHGMMTFFLGSEATEQAKWIAEMENDALRYEIGYEPAPDDDPLAFIFKDLQTNEFLRESALLAKLVQEEGGEVHPGGDLGARQNPYFVVLRTATRPAILVETGFGTNRADGRFLASRAGQKKLAQAIARGVVEYLKQYERKLIGEVP